MRIDCGRWPGARRIATAAIAIGGAMLIGVAAPQHAIGRTPPPIPAGPQTGPFPYKVHRGDTLQRIGALYLTRPGDAGIVRRINRIASPDRLVVGSTLMIPRNLLKTARLGARVMAFRGTVSIGPGRQIKRNAILWEGARIETGPNSSISMLLPDESTVTLPSQSVVVFRRFRRVVISNALERVFRLEAGRSQYQVTKSRHPGDRFEIETPVSVAAVRGTVFRASVDDDRKAAITEVVKGNVGVSGRGDAISLPAGFGARSTETSTGKPIALLPAPEIVSIIKHESNGALVFPVEPIAGAVRYRLQIAADDAFLNIRSETVSDQATVRVANVANGSYFVRATAIDANGLEGLPGVYTLDQKQGGLRQR